LKVGFKACEDYKWSSYREYLGEEGQGLSSTGFVLDVLGGNKEFVLFHSADADCTLEEPWNAGHCVLATDDEAIAVAREALGAVSPYDLRSLDREERLHALLKLREAGLSFRQISRITGISKSTVEYSLKKAK